MQKPLPSNNKNTIHDMKLFYKGRSNALKIICLAFGVTAGLLLVARVHFDKTIDTYFDDYERVYVVNSNVLRENDKQPRSYSQVSGAIAPYMMQEIPEVEVATRHTYIFDDDAKYLIDEEGTSKEINMIFADTAWFDVFQLPIIAGDPHDALRWVCGAMVSRKTAESFGGIEEAIGRTFRPKENPEINFTIKGIFEDLPENSTLSYDAVTSIYIISPQSTENWVGNDRYKAYAKLRPGIDPESVTPLIRQMQERHVDISELEEAGVDLRYDLSPFWRQHLDNEAMRNQNNLLTILAIVLIAIAVLNYILIVLSTLANRAKEIAVRKCHGSSAWGITALVIKESVANLAIAIALGAVLSWIFKDAIEGMLGVSYSALLTPGGLAIIAAILAGVLIITVAIPAWFFCHIPVSAAFSALSQSKRFWKKCLLFTEFAGTVYVVILLVNISRQYDYVINDNPGYNVENLVFVDGSVLTPEQRTTIVSELRKLPEVESSSLCCDLPIQIHSGNNVFLPDNNKELFNFADLYYVSDDYFSTMGINVIEGQAFDPNVSNATNLMISRSFVEKIRNITGMTSSPIGWQLVLTEHCYGREPFTVTGVYEDFRLGTLRNEDKRPSAIFYNAAEYPMLIMARLSSTDAEALAKVNKVLDTVAPNAELMAESYKLQITKQYESDRKLRNSIIACCIIALVISVTGLIGYVTDEVNRRRREIAIRKVNGATVGDILRMLGSGITAVAIPGMLTGAVLAWYSSARWLENFTSRVSLSVPITLACVAATYVLIMACVAIRAYNAANENPVNSLAHT